MKCVVNDDTKYGGVSLPLRRILNTLHCVINDETAFRNERNLLTQVLDNVEDIQINTDSCVT